MSNEKDQGQAAITTNSSGQPEAAGKALPTGAKIAEFEIIRVLGEGGFGIVYLAFDTLLHRHVAIKEYFPSSYAVRRDAQTITALSPNHVDTYRAGMASFIEEARLLARFEHPSLVKVLRYWEANGTAYMVMPHYQGRTLRDLLKLPDEFSTEIELRSLMSPLLDAVAVMHDEQCFHRDISPENIIIRPNSSPVLLDFGAARRILGDSTAALTVVLKQNYAPIEQYSDDGSLAQGPWTDIYALAAVMYTAIMRKPPPSAVARVYQDPVKPLTKAAPPGFTLQFLRGIDAGMSVKPEDRPRTIAAFKQGLGLGATSPAPAPAPAAAAPAPPRPAPVDESAPAPRPSPVARPASASPVARPAPPPPRRDPDSTVERAKIIVTPDSRYVPPSPSATPKTRVAALAAAAVAVALAVGGVMYLMGTRTDEPAKVATAPTPAKPPVETPKAAEAPPPAPSPPAPAAEPPPPPAPAESPPPPVQAAPPPAAEPAPPPVKPEPPAPAQTREKEKAQPQAKEKEKAPPQAREKEKEKAQPQKPAPPVAPPPPPPQAAPAKPVAPAAPPVAAAPRPAPAQEEPDAPRDLSEEGRKLFVAANRGEAGAQVALARLYAQGRGAPQSDTEAARWMRRAADQGNAEAWQALGVLYEGGRGVPKDAAEAAKWYRRAAERGNPLSQINLGALYAAGTGVPKDDAEAVAWYRKAADQGNARGQYNLALMYLTGQGVARDDAEAARLFRRAADQGLASAQLQLGSIYAAGRGVMKDEAEAIVWYRKAAAQGNAQAAERVKQLESGAR